MRRRVHQVRVEDVGGELVLDGPVWGSDLFASRSGEITVWDGGRQRHLEVRDSVARDAHWSAD